MPSLSIVVISRNEEEFIGACLASVQAAAAAVGGAEMVLADSASTDRTPDIARSLGVRVVLLSQENGLTPAAGRYVGFHQTNGDLVMFVDSDTTLDKDWFINALPFFNQSDVAGVGGALHDFAEPGRILAGEVQSAKYLRGIALYRRCALAEAGSFNPYLNSEEEAELALRLRAKGWRLLQLPHTMGQHHRSGSGRWEIAHAWQSGRFTGNGRTLRYAVAQGNGLFLCLERFGATLAFAAVLLALTITGWLLGRAQIVYGIAFVWFSLILWGGAVWRKRGNLPDTLAYFQKHLLLCVCVPWGALTTTLRDPQSYPW